MLKLLIENPSCHGIE